MVIIFNKSGQPGLSHSLPLLLNQSIVVYRKRIRFKLNDYYYCKTIQIKISRVYFLSPVLVELASSDVANSSGSVTGKLHVKFRHTQAAALPSTGFSRCRVSMRRYSKPARPPGPSATANILPGIKRDLTTSSKACVELSSVGPAINT